MLFVSNEDITQALNEKRLSTETVVDRIEEAYRELAQGKAVYSPRRGVTVPIDRAYAHDGFIDEKVTFATMEGALPSRGAMAVRMKMDVGYRLEDPVTGAKTHEKYCAEPGLFCGLVILMDSNTAEPLAMMNDGVIQHLRVAGTNALAAKYMARREARVLGIFGSGGMARSHAAAMAAVRPIELIKVYSPTRAHREAFASEIGEELGIEVHPVESPADLPDGCDIIAACTDSISAVILKEFVHPGVHLCSVTSYELEGGAVDRLDAIVLHQAIASGTVATYGTAVGSIAPNGDIEPLVRPPNAMFSTGEKVRGTLTDLVSGTIQGRTDASEVNFFYNNAGSGLQFAAIAAQVYEAVQETGTGKEIPTEWLLQDIRD